MGWLKKTFKKVERSARKYVKRLGSVDGWTGKKFTPLNFASRGLVDTRNVVRALRKNRVKKNLGRYLYRGGNSTGVGGYVVSSPQPTYVHSSRSLSQLAGGS